VLGCGCLWRSKAASSAAWAWRIPSKVNFTSHHADLALTVANQAAITMVNAELYQQAQALAALQERQRLAQNLHDAVNHRSFLPG